MATRDNLDAVLAVDAPVFTNDGRILGHVRETDFKHEQFRVDVPGDPDVWLSFDHIGSTATGYVRLDLSRADAVKQGRLAKHSSESDVATKGSGLEARGPDS